MLDYQDPPSLETENACTSMTLELNNLIRAAGTDMQEELAADLANFRKLFEKFVSEPGPSVDWDKIEKLPSDSVSSLPQSEVRCSNLALIRSAPTLTSPPAQTR